MFYANCTGDCHLRISVGLSCLQADRTLCLEALPFTINGGIVQPSSYEYSWTSDIAFGISLTVFDLRSPITLVELQGYTRTNRDNPNYTYAFTVLCEQFFPAKPNLYTHVAPSHQTHSIERIGAGEVHTFVTSVYYRLHFINIRQSRGQTVEGLSTIACYTHSIPPERNETQLVDKFLMDGRTSISNLLWSMSAATLRFGNATFDLIYAPRPPDYAIVGKTETDDDIDIQFTEELSLGYPWDVRQTMDYRAYAYSVEAAPRARMRSLLEWHRTQDRDRHCTEIVPDTPATEPVVSTTSLAVSAYLESGSNSFWSFWNLCAAGIIAICFMGAIWLVAALARLWCQQGKRFRSDALRFDAPAANQKSVFTLPGNAHILFHRSPQSGNSLELKLSAMDIFRNCRRFGSFFRTNTLADDAIKPSDGKLHFIPAASDVSQHRMWRLDAAELLVSMYPNMH
ncbi:unnamed protein product, partial [Mesorhabditis spiculigera]